MKTKQTKTVTAYYPGIGEIKITRERADKILKLQKIIRERRERKGC